MIIFIVLVIVILIIGFILKQKQDALTIEKPIVNPQPKEDTAPYAKNTTFYTNKKGVITIDKNSLDFGDIDGDEVTKVKFFNFSQPLYLNKNLRTKYIEGTELPIDTFNLFLKIINEKDFTTEYQVFANNKWSK